MQKSKPSNFRGDSKERKERRYFSKEARKSIVKEIDAGLGKREASRKYKVSVSAIYKWLHKYSETFQSSLITIVEHQSDSQRNKVLEKELSEAYQMLGRLQAEKMLLDKIIDLADQHFETDLKKSFAKRHLPISTNKRKNK